MPSGGGFANTERSGAHVRDASLQNMTTVDCCIVSICVNSMCVRGGGPPEGLLLEEVMKPLWSLFIVISLIGFDALNRSLTRPGLRPLLALAHRGGREWLGEFRVIALHVSSLQLPTGLCL